MLNLFLFFMSTITVPVAASFFNRRKSVFLTTGNEGFQRRWSPAWSGIPRDKSQKKNFKPEKEQW